MTKLYRPISLLACTLLFAGCGLFVNADERVKRANDLLSRGQYSEAMIEAQNALSSDPRNRAANLVLARIYLRMDNFEAARKAVEEAAAAGADPQELGKLRAELLLRGPKPGTLLEAFDKGTLDVAEPDRSRLRMRALGAVDRCEEAIALGRAQLQSQPDVAEARIVIADCYARHGNVPRALKEIEAGLSGQSEDPELLLAQGHLQILAGDRAGAEKSWTAALAHAAGKLSVSQRVLLHLGLAEYQSERGDVAALRGTRDKLQALVPEAPVTTLVDARIKVLEGDVTSAVNALRQLVVNDPDMPQAQILLASGNLALGNIEQSRQVLARAMQLAPQRKELKAAADILDKLGGIPATSDEYALRVAAVQTSFGQLALARLALDNAAKTAPNSLKLALANAELDLRAQQNSAAVDRLMKLDQNNPIVLTSLSKALAASNRYADAAQALERALKIAPHPAVVIGLYRMRSLGKLPAEFEPLEKWLTDHPNDLLVRVALADGLRERGDNARAVQEYEKVVAQAPQSAAALNNLAWLYYLTQDKRAVPTARKALELAPKVPAIMDTCGWILADTGSPKDGLPLLETANQAVGLAQPDVRAHYAIALQRTGDKERARQILATTLAEFGEFTGRDVAQKALDDLGPPATT